MRDLTLAEMPWLPDDADPSLVIDTTVDAHGRAVTLLGADERAVSAATARRVASSGASFPVRQAKPYDARMVIAGEGWTEVVPLSGVDLAHPMVDTLPSGEVVVAATRCDEPKADESPSISTRVFGPDGEPRRGFCLGDGIEHLMTTADGSIWTGYFDEGVFGDDPVAAWGLVRWTADHGPVRALGTAGGSRTVAQHAMSPQSR